MRRSSAKGITALELMVTMAVVAILLATAVPAFKNYTWNQRMRTAMDALQTDLNLARGRAISHNVQTVVCPAADSIACSGTPDWQAGWIIFTDLNGDRQKQQSEPLHRRANATEFLSISSSRSRSYLRFYPNGTAPGSNITILFCDRRGAQHAGKIIVSNTGRIRAETKGSEANENCP
jgi:type IV fimbrial biogenesis protein FimT